MGTGNLIRRPLEQRDLSLLASWVNHNTALSLTLDLRTPTTLKDITEWFEESRSDRYKDFIFEKDGEVRAFGRLTKMTPKIGNVFTFVYPSLINLGVGIDVVKSLCFYGFMEFKLDEIYTRIVASDISTKRTYQECGFYTDEPIPEDCRSAMFYMLRRSDWEEDYYPF